MTNHEALMRRAIGVAETARLRARPNPWVGAVLVCADGRVFEGATHEPGGPHAEIAALRAAGDAGADPRGATLVCTLEPCNHTGRTAPCTEAIISSGIARVVVGIEDPDHRVSGSGIQRLRSAGVDVVSGVCPDDVRAQLAPYLHHRSTGRPLVVLKMATTLDARAAIPNGPRWLTGESARAQVHLLRAQSDAILVGAGTVRTDDPELTTRMVDGPSPRRIVLSRSGQVPDDAKARPCTVWSGDVDDLLDHLGGDDVLQLLVEGGPTVAGEFHRRGLVDKYVFHVAPLVAGSPEAPGVFDVAPDTLLESFDLASMTVLDQDLEIVLEPRRSPHSPQKVGTP